MKFPNRIKCAFVPSTSTTFHLGPALPGFKNTLINNEKYDVVITEGAAYLILVGATYNNGFSISSVDSYEGSSGSVSVSTFTSAAEVAVTVSGQSIEQIKTDISNRYTKAEVDQIASLKASTAHTHTTTSITDFPVVTAHSGEYLTNNGSVLSWSSVGWSSISGKPSLYTASQVDTLLADKASTLHTHTHTEISDWNTATSSFLTSVPAQTWASITGKPTTVSGYGITDSYTKTEVDTALSGKSDTAHNHTGVYQPVGSYLTSINSSQVTTALGFTPYNATNPSGYISGVSWGSVGGLLGNQTDLQTALNGKASTSHTHTHTDITDWNSATASFLTVVPAQTWTSITGKPTTISGYATTDAYTKTEVDTALGSKQDTLPSQTGNAGKVLTTNGSTLSWGTVSGSGTVAWGSISGTLSNQTDLQSALDGKATTTHNHAGVYQPVGSYLTSISSSDVTTALGFTPYNATNPNGYITGISWGSITGLLSNQTDLQTVLNGKSNTGHTHVHTDITDWSSATASFLTSVPAQTWTSITGKPTTISGFGITDAYTKTEVDTALSGKASATHNHTGVYQPVGSYMG